MHIPVIKNILILVYMVFVMHIYLRELKSLEDYNLSRPNQLCILLLEMNIASKNDCMNKELEIKLLIIKKLSVPFLF